MEKGRAIVLTLYPRFIQLRLKGTREVINLDIEVALACARKVQAREAGIKV